MAIAGEDLGLTSFEIDKHQYIAGPFATLTPICGISFRKVGAEYRIDYDQFLTVWRDEEVTLEALQRRIIDGSLLWKHNIYPEGFALASITEDKKPSPALTARIRTFLFDHAKDEHKAVAFAQAGETEFLEDCRRFNPSEYEMRLLANLA
jgi:hypothetical protein